MTDRKTLDQMTSDDLDQLQDALDGAYRERAHLLGHFTTLYLSHIGRTDAAAPDWPVLIVETPAGQMSWHIAERDLDLFGHVRPTSDADRGWDGHTTEEKHERLRALTAAPRTAEAAVARARALHHPLASYPDPDTPGTVTICEGCENASSLHPCNTLAALDEPKEG